MRAALWLMGLFALAVAGAWLAGNNHGTVAVFLSPYRVDVSLNLVLLCLGALVFVLLLVQRALSALLSLPREARRWRLQQKERAAHAAMLDAMGHFMAGRFLRARKSAESVLDREASLSAAEQKLGHSVALRSLAHVMAAESAHALQDKALRETHLAQAQQEAEQASGADRQTLLEGIALRAARWLIDDRDASASLEQLRQLPTSVARRTVAMRLHLKAARLAGKPELALDTALLLAKHRAFSPAASQSLVRGLVLELIAHTHDEKALEKLWLSLPPAQRAMTEVAAEAAMRLVHLGGSAMLARQWLLPVWDVMKDAQPAWAPEAMQRLVRGVQATLADNVHLPDARPWLARIEAAQQARPTEAHLQFLAGMACQHHQLWGKAQTLLTQSVKGLKDPLMRRQAWCALAELAEQRQDASAALHAWKQAAQAV
jgi:HemY protein